MESSLETCPRCAQPQFPQGKFILIKDVTLTVPFRFFFIKTMLKVKCNLKYCPACGFSAAQDIAVL